eukprot:1153278-Pleurochrysis_carterae.AAC.1
MTKTGLEVCAKGRGRGSKTHHGVIQCLKALKTSLRASSHNLSRMHKDARAVERSDKEAFYKAASQAMKQSAAQAARNWLST